MIEDLLEHIGIEDLQPRGTEIGARCPMHEKRTGERERNPRHFFINRRTGIFHCFSCEYSGSLPTLIIDQAKVGLWDAHKLIRHFDVELGSDEVEIWEPPARSTDLEAQFAQFKPPPPRAVEKRHLQPTSIDKFHVRWDYGESAWILPIHGPGGESLWGWQAKAAEWVRNRPPGIHKAQTLFGIQVPIASSVMLVESPLDVVYLDGLGVPAMASFGAAVSDVQMRLIIERFDELVLALDNDKAGQAETRRLLENRWHHRFPISVFTYREGTKGKDPGELTRSEIEMGIIDSTLAGFW